MGFLSKLAKKIKKSPIAQMLMPMALSYAFPAMAGATGLSGLFGKMNPMMANALKQSMLGYGTAKLTGARKPGKQAMYAGLASIPFSFMSASQAANAYNEQFADVIPKETIGQEYLGERSFPFRGLSKEAPTAWGTTRNLVGPMKDYKFQKMTPWDILSKSKGAAERAALVGGELPGADIFSKISRGGKNVLGQKAAEVGARVPDWLPTIASQSAGALGEYVETQEERSAEEWKKTKEKRKKELAWMYGVPEHMIEGEMTNPWATGGGFWNKGGIASLQSGGDVSGPGTSTSDSINANLSDGEFVMTARAVENLGGGDRYAGARKMYDLMNVLDPESETMQEVA